MNPPNVRVGLRNAAVDMAQNALPARGVTESGDSALRDRLGHRAEQPSIPPPPQDADMSNETPITTQTDRVRRSQLSAVGGASPKSGEGQLISGGVARGCATVRDTDSPLRRGLAVRAMRPASRRRRSRAGRSQTRDLQTIKATHNAHSGHGPRAPRQQRHEG